MRLNKHKIKGFGYFAPVLILALTVSCSPGKSSTSAPVLSQPEVVSIPANAVPTLTPFQPVQQSAADPFVAEPAVQVLPTYTPYPTKIVQSNGISNPIEISPSLDTSSGIIYNPLTGLPVSDPSLLQRRPLAIKVGNSPDYVRPQSSLTLADVVYEYYIEWGDTRFIAVFYSNNSAQVGPVRSGRFLDEHIASMYHSFLMFKGADPRELEFFHSSDIDPFLVSVGIGTCPPYFIGPYKRDSYNNVFFDMTKWEACVQKKGLDNTPQQVSGGFFSTDVPSSQLQGSRIYTYYSEYSYNYWEYDPITMGYFRYQESVDLVKGRTQEEYIPMTDDVTKLPVTASNVVVLFAPYIFINTYNAHDEVYRIDLIDYGNAYVYRNGLAIPALWHRTEKNQPISLTDLNGAPIYLKPGQTFYEVIGTTSTMAQDGANWRFKFQTP